jgi:hypothetical protein
MPSIASPPIIFGRCLRGHREKAGVRSQMSGHEVKIDPDAGHAFENPDNRGGMQVHKH